MSKRQNVLNLLLARKGEWVTRAELEFVGGFEATRRLRELRTWAEGAGYTIEFREDKAGDPIYRLSQMESVSKDKVEDWWFCQKCGGRRAKEWTQPSMDPRWRLGPCRMCDVRQSIFVQTTAVGK